MRNINQYTDDRVLKYQGARIVDPSGKLVATPPIPEALALHVVTPDTIYNAGVPNFGPIASAPANTIVSLTTGASVWAGGDTARGIGAVSGSQVIFVSGSLVLAQPHD